VEAYKKHLARDAKFKKILNNEILLPSMKRNMAMKLVSSILSQQLSTKVAKVMHERFILLFGGKEPKPEEILKVSVDKIRAIGISQNKANYIHNVAQFVVEHKITDRKLHKLSDEEVIDLLIQIKGVGRWTVEMLLIFALGREDVFAVDDLGIQKAIQKMHKLEHLSGKDLKAKMVEVSQKWSPYRSYACLYLWKSL
jgi:DNA-3-methyladenine glycosylase II